MTRQNETGVAAADSELQQLWLLSFQQTTRGIAIDDAEGLLVAVNPAFALMHGGTPDDFVGRPFRTCFAPGEDAEPARLGERLECEEFISFQAEYRRLDGSTFPAATEAM